MAPRPVALAAVAACAAAASAGAASSASASVTARYGVEMDLGARLPQTIWGAPRAERPRSNHSISLERSRAAGAARRLQSSNGGDWPQDRYDLLNTGSTNYIGPGEINGFCRTIVLQSALLDPNAERFYSSGVTSLSGYDVWFGGGTKNTFYMMEMTGPSSWNQYNLALASLNPLNPNPPYPATPYGMVSAGAVWTPPNSSSLPQPGDNVAIPSADGAIYTVWWKVCAGVAKVIEDGVITAPNGKTYALKMDPLEAERRAMEVVPPAPAPGASFDPAAAATVYRVNKAKAWELMTGAAEAGVGVTDSDPACSQWVAQLSGGIKPSYSPTRFMAATPAGSPDLVLASESDGNVDTAGILHAFRADTGQEVWNHVAVDKAGTSWGLVGVLPASDPSRSGIIYLAYGPRVVALHPATGAILAELNDTGVLEPATPDDYVFRAGYLENGDDVFVGNLTYLQAISMCNNLPTCVAFSHNAPDQYPNYPWPMFLKSAYKFTPTPLGGWSTYQKPGFGVDPFVSSVVISPSYDALFVHSAAGTVWRIGITGDINGLNLTIVWGCDNVANPPQGYQACLTPPAVYKRAFPAPMHQPDGTVLPGNEEAGEMVHRADYVAGGWFQPTTRGDRDEMHAAVRDAYLAAHPKAASFSGRDKGELALEAGVLAKLTPVQKTSLLSVQAGVQPTLTQASAMVRVLEVEGRLPELHSMRVGSNGYTKLSDKGEALYPLVEAVPGPAAAEGEEADAKSSTAAPLTAKFNTVYPYSTPSVEENGLFLFDIMLVTQFLPYVRGDEGVFAIDTITGDVQWSFSSWTSAEGVTYYFGRSRSSPSIDGDDFVYAASDVDDPRFVGTNSSVSIPGLFAFDLFDGSLSWATTMGFPTTTLVGHASPIVVDGYGEANSAYMATDHGVVFLTEGVPCPTDDIIFECSGKGRCDCTTGVCACDANNKCIGGPACMPLPCVNGTCDTTVGCMCNPCWTGPACDQPLQCGANAQCSISTGNCTCNSGYSPDPNGNCVSPTVTATATATATATGTATSTGTSTASSKATSTSTASASSTHTSRPTMSVSSTPSAGAAAAAPVGPTPGSVAAGVLLGIPGVFLGVVGAWIALFKYNNPFKPWHSALPSSVQKRLGVSPYAQLSAPGSSPASAGAAGAPKKKGLTGMGFSSAMPSVVRGSNEESLARAKLLSAASLKAAGTGGGLAGKGGGSYGAV